jgi:hypothetical protein
MMARFCIYDKQKYRKINLIHEKGGYIKRRYACQAGS